MTMFANGKVLQETPIDDDISYIYRLNKAVNKTRQKLAWVLGTFTTRNVEFMRKLYTTVIHPNIDFCSQIWAPREGPLIDAIEKVQKDFTQHIPDLRNLSYSERLKRLRLTSLQRR